MSRAYRVRPSELVRIDPDSPAAFSYDRAVWQFGLACEQAMQEAEERYTGKKVSANVVKGARMAALARMLATPGGGTGGGQFRDPATMPVARRPRRIVGSGGRVVGRAEGGEDADGEDGSGEEIPAPPWRQEGADDRPERPQGWRS